MSNFGYFSKYLNDYLKQEIMKTEIFKVGDRVYHYTYGWGEVTSHEEDKIITVKFSDDTITFIDGKLLSFTEYTLKGFSQKRPIELPEVGELCLVRSSEYYDYNCEYFQCLNDLGQYVTMDCNGEYSYWKQMKRIKILD